MSDSMTSLTMRCLARGRRLTCSSCTRNEVGRNSVNDDSRHHRNLPRPALALAVVFFAVTGIAHASLGGVTQRVTSVKDAGTGAVQVAFQYDGHGNVYRRTQGTFDRRLNFDNADRLVSVTTNAGAMVADHVYDSFGRRTRTDTPVSGISNKNLRFQIYTPGGEFQWENAITWNYNGTGGASTQINYISLGGTLIAKQFGKSTFTTDSGARMAEGTLGFNPFVNPYEGATPGQADGTHGNAGGNGNGNAGGNGSGNAGGNGNGNGAGGNTDPNAVATTAVVSPETYSVEYVHTDALGSPVSYTSSTGSVLPYRNTRYEPYGTPTTTPRDGEPTYTGHQYDTGTGLIYAQARYYDPALGRFLGPDPMAVDTSSAFNWNRYAYANNSPYKFTDPDGLVSKELARQGYEDIGDGYVARVDKVNGLGGEAVFEVHVYEDSKSFQKAASEGNKDGLRKSEVNTLKTDGSWGKHGKPSEPPRLGKNAEKGFNRIVQRELSLRNMVESTPSGGLQMRNTLRRNLGKYSRFLGPAGALLEYTRSSVDRVCEIDPGNEAC